MNCKETKTAKKLGLTISDIAVLERTCLKLTPQVVDLVEGSRDQVTSRKRAQWVLRKLADELVK